jgi:hypothetical protein
LARSVRANAANASGVIGAGSPPTLASAVTTCGSLKMRCTSAAILSTTGRGVPPGAKRPCQPVASKPFTVSPMVGTSGAAATRCGVDTAMARTWLPLASGHSVVMLSIASWMLPPIMLFISSAVERNGTWVICVPVASWNITAARCDEVPLPDEPNVTLPSFCFIQATSSGTVLAGTSLLTTSRFGSRTSSEIGAKSFSTSNGSRA